MLKNQARILVVEDDKAIKKQLAKALPMMGFEMVGAENAEDALKLLQDLSPDLILSDIKMPGMSGLEFKKSLDLDQKYGNIPFIFLSALSGNDNIRTGMNLAADDYLTKPFRLKDLESAIHARLKRKDERDSKIKESAKRISESLQLIFPHEIATPVTIIYGMADFLQTLDMENASNRSLAVEMLESIADSALRLKDLTDKFDISLKTTLSKTSVNQPIGERKGGLLYDIKGIISSISREVSSKYGLHRHLKLNLEHSMSDLDLDFIERIVTEVVKNALQHSPKGTAVNVRGENQDDIYRLTVVDSGPGMTAQQVEHIGEFQQFDRKQKEQQGVGLGLAITKRLIEMLGGTITFSQSDQNGFQVTIDLPRPLKIDELEDERSDSTLP